MQAPLLDLYYFERVWLVVIQRACFPADACRLTDAGQGWFVITVVPAEGSPDVQRHFQQLKDGSIVVLTQSLISQGQAELAGRGNTSG
jgi:hypothetical protein